ncbi:MAG: hypothetical protein KME03_13590 [Aphanocapsa lilacina HA4352-LM1]|jgi:hypothetical protein|nr:hypothetical protein [Aphanocapsa lilacina HA4352-LM1]
MGKSRRAASRESEGLSAGAGLFWTANRRNTFAAINTLLVPGDTTFDTLVAYRLGNG